VLGLLPFYSTFCSLATHFHGCFAKKYLTEQENTFQNEEAFKLVRPSLAEQSENSESSPVTQ